MSSSRVQWHASEQVQQPMTIINHMKIDRYIAWDGVVSHLQGEGYILIPSPSPPAMDEPIAEEADVEPSTNFQRRIDRQNLRLAQRQARIHEFTIGAFTELANGFSQFSPNTDPVQLPCLLLFMLIPLLMMMATTTSTESSFREVLSLNFSYFNVMRTLIALSLGGLHLLVYL